jgi:hypothetical protein
MAVCRIADVQIEHPKNDYFGGLSSLESHLSASDCRGSGRSQSRHCIVRRPLPPGGSARIKGSPQPGQVGITACPMRNSKNGQFHLSAR